MKKAGIPCPSVALLKKHILIMSFIGKNQQPAPKLKDAVLSPRQLQQAYQQCVQVQYDSHIFTVVQKLLHTNSFLNSIILDGNKNERKNEKETPVILMKNPWKAILVLYLSTPKLCKIQFNCSKTKVSSLWQLGSTRTKT